MRRGGNSLFLIIALLMIVGAVVVAYFAFLGPDTGTPPIPPTPVPPQKVVMADIDIPAGTVITNTTTLRLKDIPGDQYVANPGNFFTNLDELKGMKAVEVLAGGQPIQTSQVVKAGLADKLPKPVPGEDAVRAFPLQVNELSGVGDQLQAGDFVDLMASFNQEVKTWTPGVPLTFTDDLNRNRRVPIGVSSGGVVFSSEITDEGVTKVLLQDIEVIDVVKEAAPPPNTTPTPAGAEQPSGPPTNNATTQPIQAPQNNSGVSLRQGNWVIMVAVTNQEAEVLRFVLDRGIGISALLRPTGDHTSQRSVGATMRILVDNFGMPIASTLPASQHTGPNPLPDIAILPREPVEKYVPPIPTREAQ